ncbi:hypothetical protein FH972_010663 [Carpinus fangiana]|uniref:Uncharacterized protein n=1 Tax=Carpinus fangiana TaxID=176857 RepID=A0A660KQU8_9ROSI|nr:hypothetical protein FH972_010663 [Carpinus fangiana]
MEMNEAKRERGAARVEMKKKEVTDGFNITPTSLADSTNTNMNLRNFLDSIDRQAKKPKNPPERIHLHTLSNPFTQFNANPDGLHPKSFKPNCGITPPKTTTDSKAIKTSKQLCFLPCNVCYISEP